MKPDAVIFDVDGTLVDVSGVRHYVMGDPRKKDFHHFHAGAALCPPMPGIVELAQAFHRAGIRVLIVTARKERWRWQTSRWLRKWEVPYATLEMRKDFDDRKDFDVKRDILTDLRRMFHVIMAVDDNPAVIALWREEGIPALVVPGWVDAPTI